MLTIPKLTEDTQKVSWTRSLDSKSVCLSHSIPECNAVKLSILWVTLW
jgi:hypothetical protein